MNIFVLDKKPSIAAKMMCDKHVVKMIVETAQILSTVQRLHGNKDAPYKSTHVNHPCTKWANASVSNYDWLYKHGVYLCREYTFRYGKVHKSQQYFDDQLSQLPENLPNIGLTEFVQCMPEIYKGLDVVEAYRKYYLGEKVHFARWTRRKMPNWFIVNEDQNKIAEIY